MEGITYQLILSAVIFVGAYALIIWDKIDRTIVALTGATLMIVLRIVDQESAFGYIDFNTIGLLISMMIIVMVIKRTGLFEFLAVRTVKAAKGEPIVILILLSLITGFVSAFLDNVTTILLILPITLSVAKDLKVNPVPFIISSVFASNVGGTGTLIGDPPNIMIGSAVGLTFMDFLRNLGVIIFPLLFLTTFVFALLYRKQLFTTDECKAKVMAVDEKECIKNIGLLRKSLAVLALTVVGFILHGMLHYESATIALVGAVILLFLSGEHIEGILKEVEWKTIFFFGGLFVMVGGIQETGIIKMIAEGVLGLTHGDIVMTTLAILWVSAIASAFVDNIPFVATMIPMIKDMGDLSGMPLEPLWWALALGACLGGNGTIIGASANVVATGMAEEAGYKITFGQYFKLAFPTMILTIVICTVYVYFAYLV
ncbi:SLC13 family permease [Clostridium aminobutyricum]|uniref:ArsB/NhaD family transporter n=1 Tax=Clostridium aminobutyricum TaxID=33953 RepID=A0A939IJE0_CLOAM|nr:ArsB/NhaD family transporter [Clostridium aminobutyricum]MBN7773474.1 ArsB/NhaD family transporter [Clostridium aminobutyricum]